MEPTSEQELKELLEEGRISEDEYQQLLEALHQKQQPQPPAPTTPSSESKSPTGYGKTALTLLIIGLLLPIVGIGLSLLSAFAGLRLGVAVIFFPLLLIGMLCCIAAFIFGIVGFKTPAGKIAAIGAPCLGLLAIIIVPLLLFMAVSFTRVEHTTERNWTSLKAWPLDSMNDVLTRDNIQLDPAVSADSNGSLKIMSDTLQKTVIRLFETGPLSIEDTLLLYSAKLKSRALDGEAYLEMWCDIPGRGEFFSRGLENAVSGTTEWTSATTPFRLENGQIPANVKLNLVIEGTGTVWIDDIKLLTSPLN